MTKDKMEAKPGPSTKHPAYALSRLIFRDVKMNALSKFTFLLRFVISDPRRIGTDDISSVDWLRQQLRNNTRLLLVAGELAKGVDNPELIAAFEQAVRRGKKISVICGPAIMVDTLSRKNKLFEYFKSVTSTNLKVYLPEQPDLEHMPFFHFGKCGQSVFLEQPHRPSEGLSDDIRVVVFTDSILWPTRLEQIFADVAERSSENLSTALELTPEELKDYETKVEFYQYAGRRERWDVHREAAATH